MSPMPVSHFTTARIEQGEILFYTQHLERLRLDAKLCFTDVKWINKAMHEARKVAAKEELATLKIVIGAAGFHLDLQPLRRKYWHEEGKAALELDFLADPREKLALQAKILDRTDYQHVPANAVFVHEGKVREGPHFHVAFLFEKKWHTPLQEEGVLYGTQRAVLLQQKNWTERILLQSEMPGAVACMAFSAHLGCASVARLGDVFFHASSA